VLQRYDARWVQQPRGQRTIVWAAHVASGTSMARNFELIAGGLNGLRAYPVEALTGRHLVRMNGEDRWKLADAMGGLFSFGAVGFVDAAHTWGAGAEGVRTWFVDGGVGLRITAPEWTLGRVFRLDVAWPISPEREGRRDAVLSVGSSQAF